MQKQINKYNHTHNIEKICNGKFKQVMCKHFLYEANFFLICFMRRHWETKFLMGNSYRRLIQDKKCLVFLVFRINVDGKFHQIDRSSLVVEYSHKHNIYEIKQLQQHDDQWILLSVYLKQKSNKTIMRNIHFHPTFFEK